MDKDKSLTLDLVEFLRLLRVWSKSNSRREGKRDILEAFKDGDHFRATRHRKDRQLPKKLTVKYGSWFDEFDTAQISELHAIAVQHEMEDAVLASHHALTSDEVRILRESFEFCDADHSGMIDHQELCVVLKDLGHVAVTNKQKKAFAETLQLEEFRGDFDFGSLCHFLATYHNACVEKVLMDIENEMQCSDASEQEQLESDHQSNPQQHIHWHVPVGKLVQALFQLGQYVNKDQVMTLLEEAGGSRALKSIDKGKFLKMLEVDRAKRMLAWKEQCGFSESQVSEINHAFSASSRGDAMKRGSAVLEALQLLNLAPPAEHRHQLLRALLRVDRQGDGIITFPDFLMLVRHLENQRLYTRSIEEKEKATAAGLDSDAVQQFRQVFNDCDPNFSGEVAIEVIQKLFSTLGIIKTYVQRKELKKVLDEVTDGSGLVFSQFLDVLHRLESQGIC
jgi:Ca2+-binding EF-hand superfamily protein